MLIKQVQWKRLECHNAKPGRYGPRIPCGLAPDESGFGRVRTEAKGLYAPREMRSGVHRLGIQLRCVLGSASDPTPRLSIASEGLVQMDTAPSMLFGTPGSPNVVAAPGRSLFQSDCVALKMILEIGWVLRSSVGNVHPSIQRARELIARLDGAEDRFFAEQIEREVDNGGIDPLEHWRSRRPEPQRRKLSDFPKGLTETEAGRLYRRIDTTARNIAEAVGAETGELEKKFRQSSPSLNSKSAN